MNGEAAGGGGFSRGGGWRRQHEEAGLGQVLLFVEAFRSTMVEGLSTLPPPPSAYGHFSGGGGEGGARLTLAIVQEKVDVVGLVAALTPWMARWRTQHPETSSALLEVRRGRSANNSRSEPHEKYNFETICKSIFFTASFLYLSGTSRYVL